MINFERYPELKSKIRFAAHEMIDMDKDNKRASAPAHLDLALHRREGRKGCSLHPFVCVQYFVITEAVEWLGLQRKISIESDSKTGLTAAQMTEVYDCHLYILPLKSGYRLAAISRFYDLNFRGTGPFLF